MSKALCVKKSDLFRVAIDPKINEIYVQNSDNLFRLKTTLEDRANCETDESLLQVIPYVTIFDKKTRDIFIYRRGQASGEQRLAGKCSIGLGGHMEVEAKPGETMIELIALETLRELEEEIGLTPTVEMHAEILRKLSENNCGVIYCTHTEVDRVHVGVSFFLGVDQEQLGKHEKDVITRGQFMSYKNIRSAVESGNIEIEQWSKMVLDSFEMAK